MCTAAHRPEQHKGGPCLLSGDPLPRGSGRGHTVFVDVDEVGAQHVQLQVVEVGNNLKPNVERDLRSQEKGHRWGGRTFNSGGGGGVSDLWLGTPRKRAPSRGPPISY